MIYIGIESADEVVLKNMKRHTTKIDYQFETVKKLEKKGINVKSMYMLGNPEDNEDTMKKTISYSKKLPNTFVQFSIFTPYPGTPAYKDFEDKIIAKKMEDFNQYNLVFKHKHIDNQILNKYKKSIFKFLF